MSKEKPKTETTESSSKAADPENQKDFLKSKKDSESTKAEPLSAKDESLSTASEMQKTRKPKPKHDSKEDKVKELTESLQRMQAEFENYKKRVENEKASFAKCANEELIKELLPIIDNFELALENSRAKDEFYKGIELIYSHLIDALQSQGLKPIESLRKKFDPYFHEAMLTEQSEEENIILEELQKGYLLNDKVVRHAKVKVSKKGAKNDDATQAKQN